MDSKETLIFHSLGMKSTPQRRAVIKCLYKNQNHPSADRVYGEILKDYPTTSFATVYNTLTKLVDAGFLRALHIDPKKKRYDIDSSTHMHLFCSKCENVFDIKDPIYLAPHLAKLKGRDLDGNQIVEIQIHLGGICRYCTSVTGSRDDTAHGSRGGREEKLA